jgi:hypothetical protein
VIGQKSLSIHWSFTVDILLIWIGQPPYDLNLTGTRQVNVLPGCSSPATFGATNAARSDPMNPRLFILTGHSRGRRKPIQRIESSSQLAHRAQSEESNYQPECKTGTGRTSGQ